MNTKGHVTNEGLPAYMRELLADADGVDVVGDELRKSAWLGLTKTLGASAAGTAVGTSAVVLSKMTVALILALVVATAAGIVVSRRGTNVDAAPAKPPSQVAPSHSLSTGNVQPSIPVASPDPVATPPSSAVSPPQNPTKFRASPQVASQATSQKTAEAEDAERILLEDARTALTRGDFQHAETALSTHRTRHPHGVLVEDREALFVILARRTGSPSAVALEQDFFVRYPDSMYRDVILRAQKQTDLTPPDLHLKDSQLSPQSNP